MTNEPTPTAPTPQRRSRRPYWLCAAALLLVAGTFLARAWIFPKKEPAPPVETQAPDMTAAVDANLRGVGHMEQFDFAAAVNDFEQAAAFAPDWQPARINLGIALLNTATKENLKRAAAVFEEIVRTQPDDLHARYCLGIIAYYENRPADAYPQFEAVARGDENDAHTWLHLGLTNPRGKQSPEAKECFARALKLNPYLNAARYLLAQHPAGHDPAKSKLLLDEHRALMDAGWESVYRITYMEMGRYAEVIGYTPDPSVPKIGPIPMFERWSAAQVRLAAGTVWATVEDFGTGGAADLQRAIRKRFGATIVLVDYNRDGRPDILILGAVVRDKQLGDLLLRNDGNGLFTDATAEAGLAGRQVSLGCSVADYDNDGFPDLLFAGSGAPRLWRNLGNGKFSDVSAAAGLNELNGVFLGATWIDIDQDGDLDLVLARFAGSPEQALAQLRGEQGGDGGVVLVLNTGEAPAAAPGAKQPGLTTRFRKEPLFDPLKERSAVIGLAFSDFDGDRDLDLLVLADRQAARGIWNDRLLRFRSAGPLGEAAANNGALLLDVDHDQRSDLLIVAADRPPTLWLNGKTESPETLARVFTAGSVNSPVLLQAQAVDLDCDSWTDVVGLSREQKPVLLQNDGAGKLVSRAAAFGPDEEMPAGLQAVAVADLDADGNPDLLLFSSGKGLEFRRNLGNGNLTVRLDLSGRRDKGAGLRTNADAVGAWAVAQTDGLWSGSERVTLQAGLGQSSLPIALGIGKHTQADLVRLRWPDGVPQAELNVSAGPVVRITELNRKGTSCPVLLVWDGERYRFVTDFLGGAALGEVNPDGSQRTPRPEESVKIEPNSLVPHNGRCRLKITEPMDEVAYLDKLELIAIDHPAAWSVYPDERLAENGPPPTQELLFFQQVHPLRRARDHRGNDVTETLRHADRQFADAFHLRSWLGFAEDHWVELDFGDVRPAGPERVILCLHGWTEYPFPESVVAAAQAGIEPMTPILEVPTANGNWRAWGELGFPAGLPRMMTRDVTEMLAESGGRFRIRTNMQVWWDQAFLARRLGESEVRRHSRTQSLPLESAMLRQRGFLREILPGGKPPVAYDDEKTEPVAITRWQGRSTRLGDVTELLRERDDRPALCGPGDEIEIAFDARALSPVPKGVERSFILRTWGYGKDSSPFTVTGGNFGPLPYRGMKSYGSFRQLPPAIEKYDREWNTRSMER